MKPIDVKDNTYVDFGKEVNDNDPNLKMVIMSEYNNIKTFLLKAILQVGLKKFLLLKKLKIQFHGHILLMIVMVRIEDLSKDRSRSI